MELFRGDTFLKQIVSSYQFRVGDKFHIAIMKNAYSKDYLYEKTITVEIESNEFDLEIEPEATRELPTRKLLLEIELTTVDGIVATNQYEIEVKADGIYERN